MSLLTDVTVVLLICHFLGDFHFQSQKIAERKLKLNKPLIAHFGIHLATLIVSNIFIFGWTGIAQMIGLIVSVWLSHCVIDFIKYCVESNNKYTFSEEVIYIIDQMLHIGWILLASEGIFQPSVDLLFLNRQLINWLLLITLITKPANISFKVVFQKYQFNIKSPTIPGAGAVIGNLERILSAIFLAMNQISAIGFIYTAKSIARFKEIEQNKAFAEYYLIGTLFSILYVVIAYYIIIII